MILALWPLLLIPLTGALLIFGVKNTVERADNAENVSLLTLGLNTMFVFMLLSKIALNTAEPQYVFRFAFRIIPNLEFLFAANLFSLLLVLAIQLAFLLIVLMLKGQKQNLKSHLVTMMLYVFCLNGYFLAQNLFTFYVFFTLMFVFVYLLLGFSAPENKKLMTFSVHGFLSVLFLFYAFIRLYCINQNGVNIGEMDIILQHNKEALSIWLSIFAAFALKMPVWPFHYGLTAAWQGAKNPLVLLSLLMFSVSSLYGFASFWPLNIPPEIEVMAPSFQFLCLLSMLFSAIGGLLYFGGRFQLFAYGVVYLLLYLTALLLPTDKLQLNFVYSLFAFLLLMTGLYTIQFHIEKESQKNNFETKGLLCLMPKAVLAYSMLLFVAIGLPVSALFWNNFVIIAEIFNYNLYTGIFVMVALTVVAVSMLKHLYHLADTSCLQKNDLEVQDISLTQFGCICFILLVLFLSFIRPLWFIYG